MEPKNFDQIRDMPDAEWKEYLKTLTIDEMFDLALQGVQTINVQVERIFEDVETKFEQKLEVDSSSKSVYDDLMTRLKK